MGQRQMKENIYIIGTTRIIATIDLDVGIDDIEVIAVHTYAVAASMTYLRSPKVAILFLS